MALLVRSAKLGPEVAITGCTGRNVALLMLYAVRTMAIREVPDSVQRGGQGSGVDLPGEHATGVGCSTLASDAV
ncbi:hypothetical protein [Catellatospora paridis]|uniref:hypothetical protein n=1 Tax=Catellatospora paridis TaxID=1617086 RepID=UPI0012D4483E|nr:hypothetical protein [Catellatospora paridis]